MIASKPTKLSPSNLLPLSSVGCKFASYFPYLFNWIHTRRERVDWRTESKYPLTARTLWEKHQDKRQNIGVRFGATTSYCMIDIDRRSPNHPYNSTANFNKVLNAIADIGLYEYLCIRSSGSQGIHLYYPIEHQVKTFDLACALRNTLEKHGLEVANGVLECFPNTKAYNSEYNAHRLPLQDASYILQHDFNPQTNDLEKFCNLWDRAAPCQDLEMLLDSFEAARKSYKANHKSNVRLNDWRTELEAIINEGWTGEGQTNDLLHKVCQYGRVFLGFNDLEKMIVWATNKITHINGFQTFCGHKTDLIRRVRDWGKYVFDHNFPMGNDKAGEEMKANKRDQEREQRNQRIRDAANSLSDRTDTAMSIREIAKAIAKQANCSIETLYKNLSLWHPEYKDVVTANIIDSEADLSLANLQQETATNSPTSTVTQITYEVLGNGSTPPNSSKFAAPPFQGLSPVGALMAKTKIKLLEGQIAARQIGRVTPEGLREIEFFKAEIAKLRSQL